MQKPETLPPPSVIAYEVTYRCNLRCTHCYHANRITHADTMAEELSTTAAIGLLDKVLNESQCSMLAFTGGEPCLRNDLEKLCAAARRFGYASGLKQISIITNGTRLDQDLTSRLFDVGVDLFEVSLNGADAAVHDGMVGVPGSFKKALETIIRLSAMKAGRALVFVGTKNNIHAWPNVLRLGFSLGIRSFLFNRYNAGGAIIPCEALFPSLSQISSALTAAQDFARQYPVTISASVPLVPCLVDPSAYPLINFGRCPAGRENAYAAVGPLGWVRPCNHSPRVLGNCLTESWENLWQNNLYLQEFAMARPNLCVECDQVTKCQGGCKAAAEVCGGDAWNIDPFLGANWEQARHRGRHFVKDKYI